MPQYTKKQRELRVGVGDNLHEMKKERRKRSEGSKNNICQVTHTDICSTVISHLSPILHNFTICLGVLKKGYIFFKKSFITQYNK